MFRPPSPQRLAALKWEIKRRYERRAKVGKRSRSMAAIRLSQLTRWMHDVYGAGVELEPCDHSVMIVRIFAHHLASLPDAGRRISSWIDRYAPWIEDTRDREYLIGEATSKPLKWSADRLAWKLRITEGTRARLNLTTIGAIDCTKEQREARRRHAKADRERRRRDAKPPIGKPWIAANVSRATWYRRRVRET